MDTKSSSRKVILSLVLATLFVASLACSAGGGTSEPGKSEAPSSGKAVSSLDDVKSATVQIEAVGSFVDPQVGTVFNAAGRGSGFIIDPSGLAVTNKHVVAGAALLKVWIGGESEELSAKVLGVSECSDLAVIDIEGDGYPYLEWSSDPIKVGVDIYVAGFPLGDPEYTLTRGVISKAKADGEVGWASVESTVEYDAQALPGNSGGPVVDENGQVVAVHYAGNTSTRQVYGISAELAKPVTDQLATGKDVDSIGINGEAVSSEDGSIVGIWVSAVTSGSPADKAGIEAGDIITKMENLVVATDGTMADYCDIIRGHDATDTLAIEVLRFSTGEMLAGQLNGDPLATSFSFSSELGGNGGAVPAEGETYGEYVAVTDDYQAIQVEVPAAWSDVDGAPWTWDNGADFASIYAAPDLQQFQENWGTPGVRFNVTADKEKVGGHIQVLDWTRSYDFLVDCELDSRYDYDDGYYRGAFDYYEKCNGTTDYMILAAVPKQNSGDILILLEVQIVSDADLDAAEHILSTFDIVGSLP
ncbi:MAG: S1C family serine protease [Chloroflexi bacterium]|nr:S1C family serine protease [Chloroflexota bacterium]